jgi:hypothetical protein
MARLMFARVAFALACLLLAVVWLSLLPGCSVDSQGLNEPRAAILSRGAPDTGVTEAVTPQDSVDAGYSAPDVTLAVPVDAVAEDSIGTVSTDGGEDTDIAHDSGPPPPSECPISGNRSLSVCTATTQICRYYDTGAPILMTGCTAEGRLCVKVCN